MSQTDEKIWWKCSNVDFTMVWGPLTCWLSRRVLKQCFLENGLTKSFTVCNLRKKVAMTIMFFVKSLKIWFNSGKGTKKWEKVFGFEDNSLYSGPKNSQNPENDTCHWRSMCYETPLTFSTSVREIFPKWRCLREMKKHDESFLMQILQECGSL